MNLDNRVFIITGGGSGLGAAVATRFVKAGARVVIADLNAKTGQEMATALGDSARFVATDVTKEEDAQNALATALKEFSHLNGLVNCAGVGFAEKVISSRGPARLDNFVKVISINLIGTFNMIRLAADAMSKEEPNADGERGVIINTASIAAFDGQVGQAAYSASKAGIVGMTLPLARDMASRGIRICTIAPGIFETPMVSWLKQEIKDALAANVPFPKRLGQPAEFAALAQHICENSMLNGEVIRLDGALRMQPT